MKVIQQSADVLIVKTELIFAVISGTGFVLMSLFAVYAYMSNAGMAEGLDCFGFAASAAVFFLFFLFSLNKTEFVFDRGRRVVNWKKRTIFTNRSGRLDFAAIKSITVQSQFDQDNARGARVAIITKSGELPLTRAYSGNTTQVTRIAEKLNQWVCSKDPDLIKESIVAALAEGRRGEALQTLVRTYSFSMREAREILASPEKLSALSPPTQTRDTEINAGDRNLVLGFTALITLVSGPLFLFWGISGFYHGISSAKWPKAEAVVTASGMRGEVDSSFSRFTVEYSYSVDGLQYHQANALHTEPGEKKGFPVLSRIYLKDREIVDRRNYRRDKHIAIYYDPDDPQSSVIIPGVSGGDWLRTILGAFFTLIFLYLARKDRRERKAGR